jgi:hypothetical protein
MSFYEKHQADRDRYVILAFHDAKAKTFAELDQKLERIERDKWNGKKLPFPILLDSTGKTLQTWGIRAFPTMFLIDPEGNIVRGGPGGGLEELLGEKLAEEQKSKK